MKIFVVKACMWLAILACAAVGLLTCLQCQHFFFHLIGGKIAEFITWIPAVILGLSSAAASFYVICAIVLLSGTVHNRLVFLREKS